jgi:hypothetical protein
LHTLLIELQDWWGTQISINRYMNEYVVISGNSVTRLWCIWKRLPEEVDNLGGRTKARRV